MTFLKKTFSIFVLVMSAFIVSDRSFAQGESSDEQDDVPVEAPSKKKDDKPKSFRRKDIDFEDRVVEGIKKSSLEAEGILKSDRQHPDLHRKRVHYKSEVNEQLKEMEFVR